KTGLDLSYYNSLHIHAGNGTDAEVVIGNARLSKSAEVHETDVIPAQEETSSQEETSAQGEIKLDDIVIDSNHTDSPLVKKWEPTATEGYEYLGYVYVGANPGYKYLELTYKGDATAFDDLRWEFVNQKTVGFGNNQYDSFAYTVEGDKIPAPAAEEQTVIIDLEASGLDVSKAIEAIHIHQTAGNGSFEITNAVLKASLPSVADIILDGDEAGASSMVGEYKAPTERGIPVDKYKYLGFATLKDVTSDYKYLILTYSGNITGLRFEFANVVDGVETLKTEPYWFNKEGQTLFFETADDSDIALDGGEGTTVVIDLEKTGIDLGKYNSVHMHCEGMGTNGNFTIGSARVATSAEVKADVDVMPQKVEPETTKPTVTTKAPVVKKPGVATVKKATKKKKATTANVTVSKVKKAVGYQIKISTSKKFTKKTTKTVESKKTKITVKKLKKNKQYYAKVRAYVLKSNKTKLYGNWSKVVKVKNTK
ncbi:MAG: hypothetical protein IKN54_04915, partial [Lachnospiraceae bacterium]|nr:hypothetical protein [Lachnospiraceae bacterium]